jgi:Leucine-rich repeat (LRR) protein/flagellar motor component MotA
MRIYETKPFKEVILLLDDRALQKVIRESDNSVLARVLSEADTETREKFLNNMTKLARTILKENLEYMNSVSQEDIEEAQKKIIGIIRSLENSGEIVISREDDLSLNDISGKTDNISGEINQDRVKDVINSIEKACKSKSLYISSYNTTEEDVKKAFAAFENRRDELAKIQSLVIDSNLLPVAAPLFETDSIQDLTINGKGNDFQWPSFLEKCQNLKSLEINWCRETELPSWIRHADSLQSLSVDFSGITSIPDWIGGFKSLTKISLKFNENLKTLPDSIGNLKNLTKLLLEYNKSLKVLPDTIGNLQSLTELSLINCKKLKTLPDSIGNLRNLTTLDISSSPVKKLPDSIENLTALEYVNICITNIHSVPKSVSSVKTFIDRMRISLIPKKYSPSYRGFVNSYYKLVKTAFQFSKIARREGLLALEDELEFFREDLFKQGMRLVVDGTDADVIREILELSIEREHDYYRKKLMEIALECVLSIQSGDNICLLITKLGSMVKIKDNPIDAAWIKYLAGDDNAFLNIDFDAAIQPEGEREEVRLIKRAVEFSEKARHEGLPALEKALDKEAIANRDIFEYGLFLMGCESEFIRDILNRLVSHETDPVQKNLGMAKAAAVLSILNGDNARILYLKLLAYFDKNIAKAMKREFKD